MNGTHTPKLAVFHEKASLSLFEISQAAHDLCEVVWIVGWDNEPDPVPRRMLARFGDVVDVSGLAEDQMIGRIADARPDGVIVFTDPPLALAAEVAERLGVPFHDPATARVLFDKFAQRTALRDAGIPVPDFVVAQPSTARSGGRMVPDGFPFPAVLKPRRGSGSRDTFLIDDIPALRTILAGCDDEDFMIEQHIDGRRRGELAIGDNMVSVESIVQGGDTRHVAVTGRFSLATPFRETGSFLPSDLSDEDLEAVTALASRASRALGARQGVLHTEIKMSPEGPRVIEVNGRLGGGIARMVDRVGGPHLMTVAMRIALALEVGPLPTVRRHPVAFFSWVLAPGDARRVEDTGGVAGLRSLPGVEEVRLNRRVGDAVDPREGGSGHVVAVEGLASSHDELARLHEQIYDTLSLRFS